MEFNLLVFYCCILWINIKSCFICQFRIAVKFILLWTKDEIFNAWKISLTKWIDCIAKIVIIHYFFKYFTLEATVYSVLTNSFSEIFSKFHMTVHCRNSFQFSEFSDQLRGVFTTLSNTYHCMRSVQIRSFF